MAKFEFFTYAIFRMARTIFSFMFLASLVEDKSMTIKVVTVGLWTVVTLFLSVYETRKGPEEDV